MTASSLHIAPVVLFLPARDEVEAVADVIGRGPVPEAALLAREEVVRRSPAEEG